MTKILIAFIFSLTLSVFPSRANALGYGDSLGISPFRDWRQMESDHFSVSFPAETEPFAIKTLEALEQAHQYFSPIFQWEPRTKVLVTIVDSTDSANGMAAAMARFGMVLFSTPPEPWYSTAYYEDWVRLLAFHEYVHYLNLDPTENWSEVLRWIYGDVVRINSFLPVWMLEGLAVYFETRFTNSGRGRSPYFEALLRAAVQEKKLGTSSYFPIDRINGDAPLFPFGEAPYFFGYQMTNEVASRATALGKSPDETLGELSIRSASRVPFLINGNLENVIQQDWYQTWENWLEKTDRRMSEQLVQLRKAPITPTRIFASDSPEFFSGAYSRDGKRFAFHYSSNDHREGLYLVDVENPDSLRRISEKTTGKSLDFTPDGKWIIHSDFYKSGYETFSELVAVAIDERGTCAHPIRLSHGLRAKDPSLSPDGTEVAYAWAQGSSTALAVSSLVLTPGEKPQLGPPQIILKPAEFDRISHPKYSPDGTRIVFSIHRNGSLGEELVLYDRAARNFTTLMADGYRNRYPTWNSNQDLFYTSDASGVDNIYRLPSNGLIGLKPMQVTHTTTAFQGFLPHPAPNSLKGFVSSLSTSGWNLAEVEIKSDGYPTSDLKVSATAAPSPSSVIQTSRSAPINRTEQQSYSPWSSLAPRQWGPMLGIYPNRLYLGAEVLGFDALDLHQYLFASAWDTLIKKPEWIAQYNNRQLGVTWSLGASLQTHQADVYEDEVFFHARRTRLSLGASYPLNQIHRQLTLGIQGNLDRESTYGPGRPGQKGPIQEPVVPSVEGNIQWSNTDSTRLAIAPEYGRRIRLLGRTYFDPFRPLHKGLLSYSEYVRLWDHWVLVPRTAALISSRRSTIESINGSIKGGSGGIFQFAIDGLPQSLDGLSIRGYPNRTFYSRLITNSGLDLRFPIYRIQRGLGTLPIYFDQLTGFAFGDAAYFPNSKILLPATGLGMRFHTRLNSAIPLTMSLEYRLGLNQDYGGHDEWIAGLNVAAPSF